MEMVRHVALGALSTTSPQLPKGAPCYGAPGTWPGARVNAQGQSRWNPCPILYPGGSLLNREDAPTVGNSQHHAGLGFLLGPVDVQAKPVHRIPKNTTSGTPSVLGFDDLLRHRQHIISKRSVEALTIAITAPARGRRDVSVWDLQVAIRAPRQAGPPVDFRAFALRCPQGVAVRLGRLPSQTLPSLPPHRSWHCHRALQPVGGASMGQVPRLLWMCQIPL